ncbi:hypothetical protein PTKIN_Ptkin14bG0048700 [Pterospermum kingtungense]
MENISKKRSNPLGRYNRLVPSTDKEKFWQIEYEYRPYSKHKTVWTCNYGWLLISQAKQEAQSCIYQFVIWKLESSEVINLPALNLKPNQIIVAGILLSPPGNPGSMVILYEENLHYIICYSFDDKQWTKRWFGKEIADIGHDKDEPGDTISQQCITYCDGKLYAATEAKGYLMVIEENRFNKNLKFRPLNCKLPASFSPCNNFSRNLLDFCGQLCWVEVSWGGVNEEDIIDIDVLKLELNGNRKKWVKVKSAEDGAFFISDNYAFSCPVNEPELKGGHIYLFQSKRFYKVNFIDKSFSASLPLQNLSEWGNSPFLAMRDLIRLCNQQGKPEYPISKLEDNNEATVNSLGDLPSDALGFIAKKLYGVDYNNFRLVCHNFRLVAPCIKWSEALLKLQSTSLSPWLVSRRGNSCATHCFMDPHSCSTYLIKIPECLLHGKVRYSKDGWLLICSPSFMLFYHPFTNNVIQLPEGVGARVHNRCWGYGLSSSPTSEDSVLVGNSFDFIYYFCRREGQWIQYHYPDLDGFKSNHNSPIYFDGAFYFLGRDGKVAVFRQNDGQNDGQVSWKILEELQSPCDSYCSNYILECGGNLLSVFVADQMVHIYKLNFTDPMTWEKVKSLENHALFVSPSSSFSVIPKMSDMENKVYFCKLYGKDIVYYCLSTDKFYTCGKKEVVADFHNTTEFLHSTWIEPR